MVVQIKAFNPEKLANAEHLGFNSEVQIFIKKHGAENIACAAEQVLYDDAVLAEVDVVNRQRGSALTADLEQLDRERDDLATFIITTFDAAKYSPLDTAREAHKQLMPFIKPYRGLQHHQNVKESAEIIGLLKDLRVEKLAVHITTLNFTPVMDLLETANKAYMELDSQRVSEMPSRMVTTTLRAEVDALYYDIVLKANATLVLTGTNAAELFITDMNNFIDKTNASYNLRLANMKRAKVDCKEVQSETCTNENCKEHGGVESQG